MNQADVSRPSRRLTAYIGIGLVLGVAVGVVGNQISTDPQQAKQIASGFAVVTDIFLRLIRMIIAPLVMATIVSGIASFGNAKAVASIGEILRYIVQAVLYYLGLSGTKPAPLQLPVPIERQMSCAKYAESRQKLLRILLNEKACRVWVKGHCLDAEHKRARLIEQWHEARAPEVEKAEQAVLQLQTLARPPRRIPEEVRTRIVTLKRRGDFQGALSEIGLFDAVPRPQSVGQPVKRMPLQPLERGRRGHQGPKMSP